jgi:hypothetical protein
MHWQVSTTGLLPMPKFLQVDEMGRNTLSNTLSIVVRGDRPETTAANASKFPACQLRTKFKPRYV